MVLAEVFSVFVEENKLLFYTGVFVMCTTPITTTLLPGMYGAFFERVIEKQKKEALRLFYVVIFSLAVSWAAAFLNDLCDAYQVPLLLKTFRSVFVRKVVEKHQGNWREVNSGEVLSKMLRMEHLVATWYPKLKSQVVPFVLSFLVVVVYFLSTDVVVSLALAAAFPLGVWFYSDRRCDQVTQEATELNTRVHEEAEDVFRNLLYVVTDHTKASELARLLSFEKAFRLKKLKSLLCLSTKKLWMAAAVVSVMAVVLYRVKTGVLEQRYTTSQMYAAVLVATYLLDNAPWFVDTLNELVTEYDAVRGVERDLREEVSTTRKSGAECGPSFRGDRDLLTAFAVSYAYGGNEVLRDVSLSVRGGEVLLLLGQVGRGKSTLLRILAGAVAPLHGFVLVDGKCDDFSEVGYIPQTPTLFSRTVYENVVHGGKRAFAREDVQAVLASLNLHLDLDAPVGKNGSRLSGGQRQLLLLAKFVLQAPKVLVMDEPTASLDEPSKRLFVEGVRRFVQDGTRAVVLSSHDPVAAALATRTESF